MHVLKGRNVHWLLPEAMRYIQSRGVERDSRNGLVLQAPTPVSSVYERPDERVEFHEERDSNPFFHLLESLWMLDGRRDVAWLSQFNSNIGRYSDDGSVFHGAYGWRWRQAFDLDQIKIIAQALLKNPDDRRQVLQMWSAPDDLGVSSKDIPCNLLAVFGVSPLDGRLDMIVYNRSNDTIWGCYGANAVHFSVLHEWMAAAVGRPLGTYTQVSFNWHLYLEPHGEMKRKLAEKCVEPPSGQGMSRCPYNAGQVDALPSGQHRRHAVARRVPDVHRVGHPDPGRVQGPVLPPCGDSDAPSLRGVQGRRREPIRKGPGAHRPRRRERLADGRSRVDQQEVPALAVKKCYLICPVRKATPQQVSDMEAYVDALESTGEYSFHLPHRDVNQTNDDGGVRICMEHADAMLGCHEIHVWLDQYGGLSTGSHFDLGMAYMLNLARKLIHEYGVGSPPDDLGRVTLFGK